MRAALYSHVNPNNVCSMYRYTKRILVCASQLLMLPRDEHIGITLIRTAAISDSHFTIQGIVNTLTSQHISMTFPATNVGATLVVPLLTLPVQRAFP